MLRKTSSYVLTCGKRTLSTTPSWSSFATVDPYTLTSSRPHTVQNLLNGAWVPSDSLITLPDPLNGDPFINVADAQKGDVDRFVSSLNSCTKSGLHNPMKNPQRYLQ